MQWWYGEYPGLFPPPTCHLVTDHVYDEWNTHNQPSANCNRFVRYIHLYTQTPHVTRFLSLLAVCDLFICHTLTWQWAYFHFHWHSKHVNQASHTSICNWFQMVNCSTKLCPSIVWRCCFYQCKQSPNILEIFNWNMYLMQINGRKIIFTWVVFPSITFQLKLVWTGEEIIN